jgi:Uma2 family endonuclease
MAISVEEIGKEKEQVEIPPTRRDYFTIPEFRRVRKVLPDLELELIFGQIVINKRSRRDYFSIEDFNAVAEELPDHRIELINGEIKMMPPPDKEHQKITGRVTTLLAYEVRQIAALGCSIGGSSSFFDVPDRFRKPDGSGPDKVCPDVSVYYDDYFDTDRCPPALLIVEVLSFSNNQHVKRDLELKRAIYAALEVPAYWVIDRRDKSVTANTELRGVEYMASDRFKGDQVLPSPGLDFLRLTPAQIFEGI